MKKFIIFFAIVILAIFAGGVFGRSVKNEDTKLVNEIAEVAESITPTPIPKAQKPAILSLPKLGITSPVEHVGMDAKGNMDVPKDDMQVAWYELGFLPGVKGNAVIAGHFDRKNGGPAVFNKLNQLEEGDEIVVTDDKGKDLTFLVTAKNKYPVSSFPVPTVFGPSQKKYLNLITCEGVFDKSAQLYSDRLVVRAELQE